nr:unnamed protein product [Callosobruchus chinensis]
MANFKTSAAVSISHATGASSNTEGFTTTSRLLRLVGDLSLFYRYSNGFCSSELTSIIPPLSKPAT